MTRHADEPQPDAPVGRYAWNEWSCSNVLAVVPATNLPQAIETAERWIQRVAAACSRFTTGSEIVSLHPGWNTVSPLLADLIRTALEVRDLTGGLVDPAVGHALEAIGYDRSIEWLIGTDLPTRSLEVAVDVTNSVDIGQIVQVGAEKVTHTDSSAGTHTDSPAGKTGRGDSRVSTPITSPVGPVLGGVAVGVTNLVETGPIVQVKAEKVTHTDSPPSKAGQVGAESRHQGEDRTADTRNMAGQVNAAGQVRIDGDRVYLPDGIVLDLGATAKAYTADAIARECVRRLGGGALVSLGGDLATRGEFPGPGWQVAVQDIDTDRPVRLSLRGNGGVATSSTRHRKWHLEGRAVHHIIDPRTGAPAPEIWRTVTVAAETCVAANAWSTAAIVSGAEAPGMLRAHAVAARLVAGDDTLVDLGLIGS